MLVGTSTGVVKVRAATYFAGAAVVPIAIVAEPNVVSVTNLISLQVEPCGKRPR